MPFSGMIGTALKTAMPTGTIETPELLAARQNREKLEEQAKNLTSRIKDLLDEVKYLETEQEHARNKKRLNALVAERDALLQQITIAKTLEQKASKIMRFKPAYCPDCGAYNMHTSESGNAIWETPPDNCCIQRAEHLIEVFKNEMAMIAEREKETERAFERKKATDIAEMERFLKRDDDKKRAQIEAREKSFYPGNKEQIAQYEEFELFVENLKQQLARGDIPDARDVRVVIASN